MDPLVQFSTALGTGAFTEDEALSTVRAFFQTHGVLDRSVRRIPVGHGEWATVDAEDFPRLAQREWALVVCPRTGRKTARRSDGAISLHQAVLRVTPGKVVDHWNGDGLDCRKQNLREATYSQNGANSRRSRANTSGFKGVYLDRTSRRKRPWVAGIKLNYRQRYLGRFATPEEAARAYDAAAREQWGVFAKLNFPEKENTACPLSAC